MSMKRIDAVAVITSVLILAAACSSGGGQAPAAVAGGGQQAASTAAGTGSGTGATPGPGQGGAGGAGGQYGGRGFNPNNFAAGQVKQISGSTITLTTNNGSLTVNAGSQTQVQKLDQGSLSDIQAGQRITVRGTRAADGTFTAQMIQLGGQFGGRGGNFQGTPRPRQGTPGASQGGGYGGRATNANNFVAGQVQQISGNTITLTTNNGSLTVNAGDQTQVQKMDQATLSDIQAGQRITAQGSLQSDGTFTAQMIQIGGLPMGGNPPPGPTPTSSD